MWGNSNYDKTEEHEKKGLGDPRVIIADTIDKNYGKVLNVLYGGKIEDQETDEPDLENPFWKAMERGLQSHELPKPNNADDI